MRCRVWALCCVLAGLCIWSSKVWALGMGEVRILSSLGQPLRAELPFWNGEDVLVSCVKVRLLHLDGSFLSFANVTLEHNAAGRLLRVNSHQALHEPALTLQVAVECAQHIERSWQILLDLPDTQRISPPLPQPTLPQIPIQTRSPRSQPVARQERFDVASAPSQIAPSGPALAPSQPTRHISSPTKQPSAKRVANTSASRDALRLTTAGDAGEQAEIERLVLSMSQGLSADSLARLERPAAPTLAPELETARALSNMQQRIRMLEAEAARLQNLSTEQDRLLQTKPQSAQTQEWLLGLLCFLLLVLLAIAWLLWRIRQLRQNAHEWQAQLAAMDVQQADAGNLQPAPAPIVAAPPAVGADLAKHPWLAEDLQQQVKAAQGPAATLDSEHLQIPEMSMPTVAEVTDVMHEAEFWISLGRLEKAAEVLELHESVQGLASPVTWLYLFDLYRQLGEQEKYVHLRARFQRRFNAQVPLWEDAQRIQEDVGPGLEHMPALLDKVASLWASPQIIPFLQSLIVDDREGLRTGFALPAYREILFLLDLAHHVERQSQTNEVP